MREPKNPNPQQEGLHAGCPNTKRLCVKCGDKYANLPNHMRNCNGGD